MAIIGELEYSKICTQWAPQMLIDAKKKRQGKPMSLTFCNNTILQERAPHHNYHAG
jgi:hypothetical protein